IHKSYIFYYRTSQAGTPIMPQNCVALPSPDLAELISGIDTISLSSEISDSANTNLEVGQEAVPVTIHPLSPNSEKLQSFASNVKGQQSVVTSSPINTNVWADSPNYVVAQHGARLSTQDLERLRTLITEFCLRSLLPYVEKQIGLLNDVISTKRVSRSLFSATKRWFSTNKPGAPGSAPSNAVIYTAESPELQLRRLGDLCFMFGHYSLAYQAYHSAKRDFAADQAWVYYAGALEMAALSAFMQGETNRKTIEYMDDAILTYANSCKMPQFATRATLLSAECLKGRGLYGEAAKQLIRMTSEDSDLRSALLLEQAAYCFIGPKMMRKYAFHAVLAGHRFSKAGQRKHSLRCYQQAYQVYYERGWSLAEDHIHFTIGRQAASLKQISEAVKAFEKLLNASSKQHAPQQAAFLREFLHTHNLLFQENNTSCTGLPILPLPLLDNDNIKVLYGPLGKQTENNIPASHVTFSMEETNDAKWSKMEELLITEAQGSPPMIFKPTVVLYSRTSNNAVKPNAVLDEPVHYSIDLHNPLHVPLPLSDVTLLWSFTCNNETVTNEMKTIDSSIDSNVIDTILLQPACKHNIVLSLTPRRVGELKVLGISYKLSNPIQTTSDSLIANSTTIIAGKRLFEITPPKLKNVKEKPGMNIYGKDYRLEMNVIEKAAFMQILFSKLSPEMLCGEIQRVEVTLKNIGNAPLTNIYIASTDAKLFTLGNMEDDRFGSEDSITKKSSRSVTKVILPISKNGVLNVGETHKMPLWVQAPHEKGTHKLDLLFYYESVESKTALKHRLCRHTWQLTVLDSIQITAVAARSGLFKDDSPTLNLIMSVKNTNQVHDPSINEIILSEVSFQSVIWSAFHSSVLPPSIKVQPQEVFHLMLKLRKKKTDSRSTISDVSLTSNEDDKTLLNSYPFINFVQRRHIQPLDVNESLNDAQQFQSQQTVERGSVSDIFALNSTLIVKWCANVTESGVITRKAVGQHHFELEHLNKTYKHPKEPRTERSEYGARLKVFGPDRNVSSAVSVPLKDPVWEAEYLKSLISFSLSHHRQITHDFRQSRLCIVPVTMYLQNHSEMRVDVKISTIGTSSETHLPNIKSQLYSPQASTYYKYAGHSSIYSNVEAHASNIIKLLAVLPGTGTYDLAARIEISIKVVNSEEYIPQKGKMESICVINEGST
ncbi:trafficking protein particle complex subunit 8-like, partial [Pogonomyrmex barbatus]|uniref:Trafficking protein particle complex subunit 8-like n=1 Tax=Pogonomyrmex barbatus TaxID=144034 RepID=A0A6I9VXF7_9HYME